MAKYSRDLLYSIDTIFFGRVTYELMASYWPTATTEDLIITDKMNNLPKIVFSKTLEKADWKNTILVKEINKEKILKMKQSRHGRDKDMVIFGRAALYQLLRNLVSLMNIGL